MGQQQLLLIVLGAIIVGIAVVVGINMMGDAANQANVDAVRQDILTLASSAQQWYQKPAMMQGGNHSYVGLDFDEISFPIDSVDNTAETAWNANGVYSISAQNDSTFTVDATAETAGESFTVVIDREGNPTWQ